MITNRLANETFEISPRFRSTLEERIARLERDAEHDEAQVSQLQDGDHILRHLPPAVGQMLAGGSHWLFTFHTCRDQGDWMN